MMKWVRRILLYPVVVLVILIAGYLFFNKNAYYFLKGLYGTQLQWFGYEEKGNRIIENSIKDLTHVDAELYHAYSVGNTKNGNYDEAIRYLNKAAELDPRNVDEYLGWCLLYYYRDYDKALFHLHRLDSLTNSVVYVGDDNSLYAKALCYKGKGDYKRALELLLESIDYEVRVHNEKWITHQMLFQTGRVLHLLDRPSEAIPYYNQAIANWDGSSESFYYKGLAEIELGLDSGCENMEQALLKLKKGIKSSDAYIRLFDEIYIGQVEEMIKLMCL